MALGNKKMKERVAKLLQEMIDGNASDEYKALAQEWIDNKEDADKTKEIAPKLRKCIAESAAAGCPVCKELQTLDHYLVKRSQWIIGGDGASYDIGYGGLDHVIASGEDVNILVLDTEVYSNTGGQASKATPLGAIAQFFDEQSVPMGRARCSG
jgi:pyruvate-ferredoxin/flavodoxin oxidoreductase